MGIGKQEAIKYFFGGNAIIAIIVIFLICLFLVKEAFFFFPDYRKNLSLYRLSGQEFADYPMAQIVAQKRLASLATEARSYEIKYRQGVEGDIPSLNSAIRNMLRNKVNSEITELRRAEEQVEEIDFYPNLEESEKQARHQRVATAQEQLKKAAEEASLTINYNDLSDKTLETSPKYLDDLRQAAVTRLVTGEKSAFIERIEKSLAEKSIEISKDQNLLDLAEANKLLREPQRDFDQFVSKLRKITISTKQQAQQYQSSSARRLALESGAALASSDEDKERLAIEAKRILTIQPDYTKLNQPLYNSLDKHAELQAQLEASTRAALEKIPSADGFESGAAKKRLKEIASIKSGIYDLFAENRAKMEVWDHTKAYPMSQAVTGFFFGTEWITNSSWQDFYGILPLFTGSLGAAIIAVVLAVPFAVGGAIYVNRLASPVEQNIVKPVIEFIQAIPSIVLAFFGVVVLGQFLFDIGQNPALSWIPGFPIEGRLTMLNAGILLAFMAIPTIFTLAEDALNNVPKSYKEASLALGATNLQTVLKVILPSCLSGIIAAVLLGFGRIVGETMVVLLVMGGRIKIPTAFTDPAHSMTGILAQEIGEVVQGSLHWGALFMVGLVLFIVSLSLNFTAQTILRRYSDR